MSPKRVECFDVLSGLGESGGVRLARRIGSENDPQVLGLCDLLEALACEEADTVDCCL